MTSLLNSEGVTAVIAVVGSASWWKSLHDGKNQTRGGTALRVFLELRLMGTPKPEARDMCRKIIAMRNGIAESGQALEMGF